MTEKTKAQEEPINLNVKLQTDLISRIQLILTSARDWLDSDILKASVTVIAEEFDAAVERARVEFVNDPFAEMDEFNLRMTDAYRQQMDNAQVGDITIEDLNGALDKLQD